jgi:hypothetical protein
MAVAGLPVLHFAPFLQEYRITPPVSVRIIVYNANGNHFFLQVFLRSGL